MALTDIQKVRLEVGDTDVEFPILNDSSYEYFLEKNNNNIIRSAIDAAKAILFQLSTRSSETVDIFSVKNTSADSYRNALQLFIKDPNLNPLYSNLKGWFGGVSLKEMDENDNNLDNNIIKSPSKDRSTIFTGYFTYVDRYNV
jgi:hypothetical protein